MPGVIAIESKSGSNKNLLDQMMADLKEAEAKTQ